MKTPFEGQFKIVPTDLPDSVKREFLQDNVPHYIWLALPEPVRLGGQGFSFAVLPVKLTPELALEQSGRGVLCQTEAETKESMELLAQRNRKPIVLPLRFLKSTKQSQPARFLTKNVRMLTFWIWWKKAAILRPKQSEVI